MNTKRSEGSTEFVRNFAIIAHIDHGKSTLADRLMEQVGLLEPAATETPRIDRMELEIERGVTIKLKAVRLPYTLNTKPYTLNMIDTPGHADFSYEVSRSLAACEGVLLLVDATQGVQAQTLSHLEKARDLGLTVIGVINKIDSPLARVVETERELRDLGVGGEIIRISALRGEGVGKILPAVAERIPSPRGDYSAPLRALVFDSVFDAHLGAMAYVRVVDGRLGVGTQIKLLGTGVETKAKEIGYFSPERETAPLLGTGEIGFLATGFRDPRDVRVGDTVVDLGKRIAAALPGYQPPQSFVFASFFSKNAKFEEFRKALQTLRLEEPAIAVEEISSRAFGRGFRIGFLGTFHLEIVKERLEREFGLELVVTKPTVAFRGLAEEPWISITILTPSEFLSGAVKLINARRGRLGKTETLGHRLKLSAELPLLEFVRGFYDALKSVSHGYASLFWDFLGYRSAELAELEILVHNELVEGLTETVLKGEAERVGREKIKRLKEILPRQLFAYAIQARVGGKILAREDVSAARKDVLAKLSGGHVERKMKKLQEQKKGKARLAKFGKVEIPPAAFLV